MTIRPFLHLEPPASFSNFSQLTAYVRRLYEAIFLVGRGKIECVVELTLTANVATTTLTDHRLSIQSTVNFDPVTANAAAAIAAGTMYVTTANRSEGSFVITHANNAQTDRSFLVAIIG